MQKSPKKKGTKAKSKSKSKFEATFDASKKEIENPQDVHIDPNYKPPKLEMKIIPPLEENVQFSSLKEWLEEFGAEVQTKYFIDDIRDDKLHLTIILHRSLSNLIREILNTHDKADQAEYITRVYDWFLKKRKREKTTIKKELGLPYSEKENEEPKDYLTVEPKQLYEENRRTIYPEIPPPKDRLTDYNLKKVEIKAIVPEEVTLENEKKETAANLLPSLPLIKDKSNIDASLDTTANIEAQSNFMYYKPRYTDEQKVERVWFAKKNQEIIQKRTSEEFSKSVSEWGFARSRFNENITRKYENKNYANNFFIRNFETKAIRPKTTDKVVNKTNYQEIYNEESSVDENEEVKPFTSKSFVKSVDHRRVRHKLPEIVDVSKCKAEEVNKSPVKKVHRVVGKKKKKKAKKVREPIPRIATALNESRKDRVNYIRKMYGHLIGETTDNMEGAANIFINGPKGINSLSIYNKDVKRPYTVNNSMAVTTDLPITHQGEREQFRVNQMKEINTIKEYLAKEEVPCPIAALQRAILVPEDYPVLKMTAENFIQPGNRLIVNPFAKKKKKKGKKKKGKKR